jgi:hypothetical protein
MRDFTYIEGYRFSIFNLYRSKRFDVDRLDINYADKDKPKFVRGFRIKDHFTDVSCSVDGEDADNLAYSLCYIHCSNKEDRPDQFDEYLIKAMLRSEFLVHNLYEEECPVDAPMH